MLPVLLTVTIFLTLIYILNYNEKTKMMMKIPGPKHHFVFGNALGILMRSPEFLFKWMEESTLKYKDIFAMDICLMSAVCIYNPQDVELITSNSKYNKKAWVYNFLKSWLQDGLLLSNGSKWYKRRKILTPAFHFNVLKKYFHSIKANDNILIDNLKKSEGGPLDIIPVVSEYTLNTICETAMGLKLGEEKSKEAKEYKDAIHNVGDIVIKRFLRIWLHPDLIFNLSYIGNQCRKYITTIHKFTRDVIEKRKKSLKEDKVNLSSSINTIECRKIKNTAMLDLLISTEKEGLIDNTGIEEEVDTFMFEGHDTTSAAITYCLLLLANYPDIQNKVVEELQSIFGNDTREATTDDLAAMRYLDLCIKESLRLYPPVPFIFRQISEPVTLSNYNVPGNIFCLISIYHLHRNESVYKDPNKFVPERFLPENSVGRHSYAYIPFSAGPRNCIGQKFAIMEMKSVISSILRNFELVPVTKESDLRFMMNVVLRTTHPVYVKFLERELLKN